MTAPELLDVLDESGSSTGLTKTKDEILRAGDWRLVTHVWVVDDAGKLLIQRRSSGKHGRGIFDGLWDVSVGGGVRAGEEGLDAAVRETMEELGLDLQPAAFQPLGRWKIQPKPVDEDRVMNDFSDEFLVRLAHVDLGSLALQEAEVSETQMMPLTELRENFQNPDFAKHWVPHGTAYYVGVIDAILAEMQKKRQQ